MRAIIAAGIALCLLIAPAGAGVVTAHAQPKHIALAGQRPSFTSSPLTTGNGFGFAIVSPTGVVTKLYAHPYRFERANEDKTKDGYNTANFLRHMSWSTANNLASASPAKVDYLDESQIISVNTSDSEMRYFMPFGLARNALVAVRQSSSSQSDTSACLRPQWLHAIERRQVSEVGGRQVLLLKFQGVREELAVVALADNALSPTATTRRETTESDCLPGNGWVFVTLENEDQLRPAVEDVIAWQGSTPVNALAQREVDSLDKWRVPPPAGLSAEEGKLWRQSETILRMAQIREPNTRSRFNHGLMLASLPDGVWFIPWVRDMSYAVVALIRMGHLDEAREALAAYLNARPLGLWRDETRGLDYQISVVRYYGDGSEESDYSGQTTPNVEFDDWGLVLWAIDEYLTKTNDFAWLQTPTYRGTAYESIRDFIVQPLLGNLDSYGDGLIVAKDSSLWEEHQLNKRHYAFSTIMAIRGLRGFMKMARAMNDQPALNMVAAKLPLLEKGYKNAFIHDGVLWGTVEPSFKNEIDGSSLEAFNFDVVSDPALIKNTLSKMSLLKTASGGYRRVRGDTDYEKQEFVFVDFYLARLYLKLGRTAEAVAMLNPIIHEAIQDHGFIPEMYVSIEGGDYPGKVGDPTGANPMVGYGAGAFVMATMDAHMRQ